MYTDIFKYIQTLTDAHKCIENIDLLKADIYQVSTKSCEDFIRERFDSQLAAIFLADLAAKGIDLNNLDKSQDYFTGLEKAFKNVKTISLTLAIEPDRNLITAVYDLLGGASPAGSFLLDIQVDPSILGGILIAIGGQYLDLSMKKDLGEWFKQKYQYLQEI